MGGGRKLSGLEYRDCLPQTHREMVHKLGKVLLIAIASVYLTLALCMLLQRPTPLYRDWSYPHLSEEQTDADLTTLLNSF